MNVKLTMEDVICMFYVKTKMEVIYVPLVLLASVVIVTLFALV